MSETIIDCISEEGITIGLIDSLISIARVLSKRDLKATDQIKEALKDLGNDEDIDFVLSPKITLIEKEALRLVSESVKHISDVYHEPKKITKYGNSLILTFENEKKYRIGLMELFNSQTTLD